MSSFREIALNVIDSDTLLGRSMYTVDISAHALIEMQTEFFLRKGGKIEPVPMGASAEYNPIHQRAESIKNGSKAGGAHNKLQAKLKKAESKPISLFPDNSVKRNKKNRSSGLQNIRILKNGKGNVTVGGINIGTFPLEQAIEVRDSYRAKNGYPSVN